MLTMRHEVKESLGAMSSVLYSDCQAESGRRSQLKTVTEIPHASSNICEVATCLKFSCKKKLDFLPSIRLAVDSHASSKFFHQCC